MNLKYLLIVLFALILGEGIYFYFFQYIPNHKSEEVVLKEKQTEELKEKNDNAASKSGETTVFKEAVEIEADFSAKIESLNNEINDLEKIADQEDLNTINEDLLEVESLN